MPSHLHHVIHFNVGDATNVRIACNRDLAVRYTDYSLTTRGVTCKRCKTSTAYQNAERQAFKADAKIGQRYVDGVPFIQSGELQWEEIGGCLDVAPEAWLKAHIVICGVDMHLEALEIVEDDDGMQVGICPDLDEILREYCVACAAEGHFQTMRRNGLTYALFATPFC